MVRFRVKNEATVGEVFSSLDLLNSSCLDVVLALDGF